ncbi:hypothetical protein L3Y34_003534 [Caenorhabditis briggsae]|uniref:Uncharacterized protein n=1 Tax=Caenorhabditis briggsae TaxID=6238 RepID=A0AAE9D3E9_CAEBR|nr:hypothetical protein L3Y34_003534 [Caenorhabditis briggsae]
MFSPNLNDKFWYRDVSKENQTATAITEIDLFRVADFYSNGDYEAAKQILTDLRENTKNNRTHEIMLIDSLLQCTKEGGLCQSETDYCLRLLSEYESLLVDSGDQVQFLRTKASILAKFDKNIEFRNTMALLCHLCGSFDNWQLFESGAKFFNDVELGFVKEKLEKKLKKIEEEEQYLAGKLQQDDIDSILSSLNSNKDVISPESATSFVFRAHDSRSKNKLIPVADHPSVISDFFHRFPFLS